MRADTIKKIRRTTAKACYRVGNRIFRCHARHGHGIVDAAKSIEVSCNVYYYAEGIRMGIDVISAEANDSVSTRKRKSRCLETSRIVVPTKEWKRESRRRLGSGRYGKYLDRSGYLLVDTSSNGDVYGLARARRNADEADSAGTDC